MSLVPKRKKAGDFDCTSGWWFWLLGTPVGLAVGYGPSYRPGHLVFVTRPDGLDLVNNDGGAVTKDETLVMELLARLYLEQQAALWEEFNKLDDKAKLYMANPPAEENHLNLAAKFCEWVVGTGGFRVT